jgi:ADP-heptose:LPS heptosyltransferase
VALSRPAGRPRAGVAFRHPGADRGRPVDLSVARRILVVRPDNIGDVVLLTPALRALRAAAPQAWIELLASPAGTSVAAMIPELDGVLTVSPNWQQLTAPADGPGAEAAVRAERELLDRLTAGGYDVMLVFTSFSQSPWPVAHLGLLAGIATRVVHSREFAGAVATHWVTPPADTTHHVDRSLHLLEAIGVPLRGRTPSLRIPAAAFAEADDLVGARPAGPAHPRTLGDTVRMRAMTDTTATVATASARSIPAAATTATMRLHRPSAGGASGRPGPRFALVVPGASCPSRRYPAARFGAAAAEITASGLPVLVAGTAAEADLVDEVVRTSGSPDVRPLPAVGLPVFAALIARAAVALTNNSGGLHLAEAVGTPVVVTYAGTERLADVAPRSVPCALLQVPVSCSPCRQLACPFHLECLDVAPERLVDAALRLAEHGTPEVPRAGSRSRVPALLGAPAFGAPLSEISVSDPPVSDIPPSDHPVSDTPEEHRWPHIPAPWTA